MEINQFHKSVCYNCIAATKDPQVKRLRCRFLGMSMAAGEPHLCGVKKNIPRRFNPQFTKGKGLVCNCKDDKQQKRQAPTSLRPSGRRRKPAVDE